MSKRQVILDYNTSMGILNPSVLAEHDVEFETLTKIKEILKKHSPTACCYWSKPARECLSFIGLAGFIALMVPLNIFAFPLGFLGIPYWVIHIILVNYPSYSNYMNAIIEGDEASHEIDKLTNSKVRVTYNISKPKLIHSIKVYLT